MKVRMTLKGNIKITLNEDEARKLAAVLNISATLDYRTGVSGEMRDQIEVVSGELHQRMWDLDIKSSDLL